MGWEFSSRCRPLFLATNLLEDSWFFWKANAEGYFSVEIIALALSLGFIGLIDDFRSVPPDGESYFLRRRLWRTNYSARAARRDYHLS